MSQTGSDVRSAAQADAREHGVALRLPSPDALPGDDDAHRTQIAETVQDAVHTALHGVALAQVDASEVIVEAHRSQDHQVDVEAHLKD